MSTSSEAIATLFVYQPETGKTSADVFRESDEHNDGKDPYHRADALRNALGDDFPDAIITIGVNERARALMLLTRMRRMGFEDYTEADALAQVGG